MSAVRCSNLTGRALTAPLIGILFAFIVFFGCQTVQPGLPYNFGADGLLIPCSTVAGTTCDVVLVKEGEPSDGEAWAFEARLVETVNFIRVGRVPHDILVAGTQETCEAYRAGFRVRDPYGRVEAPPTEPCKQHLFFRKTGGR